MTRSTSLHFIIPPYLLERLEQNATDEARRERFRRTRELDRRRRERRTSAPPVPPDQPERSAEAEGGALDRVVYDAKNGIDLPGTQVRVEGGPVSWDRAVNQAYDGTGATWTMYNA